MSKRCGKQQVQLFSAERDKLPVRSHLLDIADVSSVPAPSGGAPGSLHGHALSLADLCLCAEVSPQSITDDVLEAFMSFCLENLRELHAVGCSGVTDRSIKAACNLCPSLRHIDLRRTSVTEQGIMLLGKKQRRLESVWLSGTESVTDFSVTRLVLSLKRLSDLRLRNCNKLSDDALVPLIQKTSLQVLDLGGLSSLSEEALVRLVRTSSRLTHLNLSRCSLVGSDLVWNIGPRVSVRLKPASDEEDEDGDSQGSCDDDKACDSWEDLSDTVEMHRTLGLPYLRALSLAKCCLVTDSGLSRVSQCLQLEELDISDCERVTDSSVMSILKACSLRALVLRGCKGLTDGTLQAICPPLESAIFCSVWRRFVGSPSWRWCI